MQKFCLYGLVCFAVCIITGCAPAKPSAPSTEKVKELDNAMDADMKNMMQQVPKTPKAK